MPLNGAFFVYRWDFSVNIAMLIIDIAEEIMRELGEPEDISLPSVSFWLASNVGKLNTLLDLEISVVDNEFDPEVTEDQKIIFKKLYELHYYSRQIQKNLGASAYDWSEIIEGDTQIRRVSKNEIAKNYASLRRELQAEIDALVFFYKQNQCLPASYSAYTDIIRYNRGTV